MLTTEEDSSPTGQPESWGSTNAHHIWISYLHQFHPLPGTFVGADQPEKALPPPHSPTSSEGVWVPPPATSSPPTPRLPVGIQPWAQVSLGFLRASLTGLEVSASVMESTAKNSDLIRLQPRAWWPGGRGAGAKLALWGHVPA